MWVAAWHDTTLRTTGWERDEETCTTSTIFCIPQECKSRQGRYAHHRVGWCAGTSRCGGGEGWHGMARSEPAQGFTVIGIYRKADEPTKSRIWLSGSSPRLIKRSKIAGRIIEIGTRQIPEQEEAHIFLCPTFQFFGVIQPPDEGNAVDTPAKWMLGTSRRPHWEWWSDSHWGNSKVQPGVFLSRIGICPERFRYKPGYGYDQRGEVKVHTETRTRWVP